MKDDQPYLPILVLNCGFQLAQLVKFLVVEQETWVQIPPTPKINWCLGLMVRATIISGRHRFKFYHNYKKKKSIANAILFYFLFFYFYLFFIARDLGLEKRS